MGEGQEIVEEVVTIQSIETHTCWNKQATQHIQANLSQAKLVLSQVFIAERNEQQHAYGARQAGEKTKQARQPPVTTAHVIEAQQGEANKQRLVVTCGKEEGSRKHREIESCTKGSLRIKIFLRQP